jgi:hypothetical protein
MADPACSGRIGLTLERMPRFVKDLFAVAVASGARHKAEEAGRVMASMIWEEGAMCPAGIGRTHGCALTKPRLSGSEFNVLG